MKQSGKKPLGIIVYGACGRMGHAVTKLATESTGFRLTALIEKKGHSAVGSAAGTPAAGLQVLDRIPSAAGPDEIVIDFSEKSGFASLMKQLAGRRLRLVCGTTGLTAGDIAALRRYARKTAVIYDTNMSIGITALKQLFKTAHAVLGDDFDTEIIETHHRYKKDFPSGTALSLAKEIAADKDIIVGRGRSRIRKQHTLHLHSIRAGGTPGDHSIIISSDEEIVTLSHRALSRDVFARGALRAAQFIASRTSGLFSMKNVLDENDG